MIAAAPYFVIQNLHGDPTRSPVNTPTASQISRTRGYYPVRATPAGFSGIPTASSDAEARQLEIAEEQLKLSKIGSKITITLAVLTIGFGAFTLWQSLRKRKGR